MLLKTIARKIVFPTITALGLEKLLHLASKNKRMALMYHGVAPKPDFAISAGHIDAAQFEQHLKYFRKNFNVVSSEEMFEMYKNNIIPKKPTVCLTFDDGYENNYTYAFPLLKKYKMPATFFIATQCLEDENAILWYDILYFVKNKIRFCEVDSSENISNSEFVEKFKKLTTSEKKLFLEKLKAKINYEEIIKNGNRDMWKTLNRKQVKELADSGLIEIGSHSHSHPNLGDIPLNEAKEEIEKSKKLIEETTGKKVISIAFPDGSYNDAVKKNCMDCGYKNLFAVEYRLQSDSNSQNILPRFCISCTTTAESNIIQINAGFGKAGF